MSGTPFRSSLRSVDGGCKEGSHQSCWGALVTVAELWLLALWRPRSLRGVGGMLNIPSPSARSISKSCMTSVAKIDFPSCGVYAECEGCSGSCGSLSHCIRATRCLVCVLRCQPCGAPQGHPSFSLPSGLSLHIYIWETEEHVVRGRIDRLFQTVLLFKDLT